MDINRANIEALFQQFEVIFTDAFNAERDQGIFEQIAMTIPSRSSGTVQAWLTQLPMMREWVGDRIVHNLESDNLTVTNKLYESTIGMKRTSIEDDEHGIYTPTVQLMGSNAAANPDKLVFEELVGDVNWLADSASFFGTSRVYGSNTISNKTTSALSETTFETAYQTMSSYLGQNDEALMVRPAYLVYGPALRTTAHDIVVNKFRASSSAAIENRNAGLVAPLEWKRLVGTYANYWFVFGEIGGIKGCAYQERLPAEIQRARMDPNSDWVFETDEFQFGARARGRGFLGLPHLIYAGYVAA